MKYVKWFDSAAPKGWVWENEIDASVVVVESVGWIINEDDESITLSSHRTNHGQSHSPMTIPKVAIAEIKDTEFDITKSSIDEWTENDSL